MRSLPASLGYLSLAIALIIAPLPVTEALQPMLSASAADACCGCCPVVETVCATPAEPACCSTGNHRSTDEQESERPASSEPCESDCGQCPCCALVVPAPPAILSRVTQTLQPSHFAAVVIANDLLSTRSDVPLLPPPRG